MCIIDKIFDKIIKLNHEPLRALERVDKMMQYWEPSREDGYNCNRGINCSFGICDECSRTHRGEKENEEKEEMQLHKV